MCVMCMGTYVMAGLWKLEDNLQELVLYLGMLRIVLGLLGFMGVNCFL